MKLHIGCGNVYLDGWTNIDLNIPGYSYLAKDRPDVVSLNRTTLDRYYVHPYQRDQIAYDRICVADEFMDARRLQYGSDSIEEILVVQLIEHFSALEVDDLLREWLRVLKPGGRLIVDTPDLEGLMREFLAEPDEGRREYYYRMIFGSHKNPGAAHKDGYTLAKLTRVLQVAGFAGVRDLGNILEHPYPALTVVAWKE